MVEACPTCGARLAAHGPRHCLTLGRVLALVGGLAAAAAYFMPWLGFSMQGQGVTLSGEFLGRFLGGASPAELARVMPGLRGDPAELLGLRALVLSFPVAGALVALLALLPAFRPRVRAWADALAALLGVVLLVAVALGIGLLPAAATPQIGLGLIGAGGVAILLGLGLDTALRRRARRASLPAPQLATAEQPPLGPDRAP